MHEPSALTSVIVHGMSSELGLSIPLPRVREGPCPGPPHRAPWCSSSWPCLCEGPLPTLWLSYARPQWYFQSTIMRSRISFAWLTVLPICGPIKFCALETERKSTGGANWETARMTGAWDGALHQGSGALASLPVRECGVWQWCTEHLSSRVQTEMEEVGLDLESQGLIPSELCYLLAVVLYKFPLYQKEKFSLLHEL